MHALWTTIFYNPLYNVLIFFTSVIPFHDIGFSVIALTILVKLALFPITKKSIITQVKQRAMEGAIEEIKKQYPDKQEQAKKTFELYKKNKFNPFSSCLLVLIQFPILIALIYVMQGIATNASALYSFVHMPEYLNTNFLSLIDVSKPSILLAVLAGLSQFVQFRLAMPPKKAAPVEPDDSFKGQLQKNMQMQMQYFMPILIIFVGMKFSGAVALYWITSNIFTIIQEWSLRRHKQELVVIK